MNLFQLMKKEMEQSREYRIPFSRFMELVLYHPVEGYYMRSRPKLGKSGDFFTNAHVGSVFGQTLCRLFLQMVTEVEKPWALVEIGSGDGLLIEQMCVEFIKLGVDPTSVHLYLIETSPYHQELQKERLSGYPFSIKWASRVSDIPSYPYSMVYSNELVDALPVHRVKRVSEEEIAEIYITVDLDNHQLIELDRPVSDPQLIAFLEQFEYS